MMNTFITKIKTDCLYRSIIDCKIEYHAGLFFVYKKTAYLRFYSNGELRFYTRIEGEHPDDTNFLKVYDLIDQTDDNVQTVNITEVDWNHMIAETTINRNGNDIDFFIMPSILTENVDGVTISELILDSRSTNNKITEVYNRIIV
ncbi:MAG: hypothetical protein IKW77_07400 [Salinivirgaceae bacterium]|nr:hypothetical protein [Salinivirgaceae bacterium]